MTWNEKLRKIHEFIGFMQVELTEIERRTFFHELSHDVCLNCCKDLPFDCRCNVQEG